MKTKLIALTLCIAVLITPIVNAGEHDNQAQKNSTARRIGFFLLHGVSFLGGLGTTYYAGGMASASVAIKNSSEQEQDKIHRTFFAQAKEEGHDDENSEKIAAISMSILKNPATAPVSGTLAVGGVAATIYGLQGLIKDLVSIFE